jgi:hypothetical protein
MSIIRLNLFWAYFVKYVIIIADLSRICSHPPDVPKQT